MEKEAKGRVKDSGEKGKWKSNESKKGKGQRERKGKGPVTFQICAHL